MKKKRMMKKENKGVQLLFFFLSCQFFRAQSGDKKALDELMEKHKPLVFFTWEKFFSGPISEEKINIGMVALWQAILRYSPVKATFSTFAVHYIWGYLKRSFKKNASEENLPLFFPSQVAANELEGDFWSNKTRKRNLSRDLANFELDNLVEAIGKFMSFRERFIVDHLRKGYSQSDIAAKLNISRERVRQIKEDTFSKFRDQKVFS